MKTHHKILTSLLGLAFLAVPLALSQNTFAEEIDYFDNTDLTSCIENYESYEGGIPNDLVCVVPIGTRFKSSDSIGLMMYNLQTGDMPNLRSVTLEELGVGSNFATAVAYFSADTTTFEDIKYPGLSYDFFNFKQIFIFGTTPAHPADFLKEYENLQELAIITDIDDEGTSLSEIDLSNNTKLTSIEFIDTAFSEFDPSIFPDLESLILQNNKNLTGELDLTKNSKLKNVNLAGTKFEKILAYKSENLERLGVEYYDGLKKIVLPETFSKMTDDELSDNLFTFYQGSLDSLNHDDSVAVITELREAGIIVFGADGIDVPKTGGFLIEPEFAATISLTAAAVCIVAFGIIHFVVKNYHKVRFDK